MLFRGAMKVHLLGGHRPHVLFGTKELEENRAPIFLPLLLRSRLENYAQNGELKLTKDSDRETVRRLTEEARKDIKKLEMGWVGAYKGEGVGQGKYVCDDGGFDEGEFKDGELHGHGKEVLSYGDVYEGQFKEGVPHGKGRYAFANGEVYEGEFEADLRHGSGTTVNADGTVVLGTYEKGQLDGPVTVRYADGKAFVGRCEAGTNVGLGAKWSADRQQAWEMRDGFTETRSISLAEAAQIAEGIGLPVP